MLCVAEGLDMGHCECLCDLIEAEGQKQVERLLLSAADNYWTTHYQPLATLQS
jgi:hypothetical protein